MKSKAVVLALLLGSVGNRAASQAIHDTSAVCHCPQKKDSAGTGKEKDGVAVPVAPTTRKTTTTIKPPQTESKAAGSQGNQYQYSNQSPGECADTWLGRLKCDPVASFTGALAVLTLVLVAVAIRQGNQIEREFIATHRPNLIVRSVGFHTPKPVGATPPTGAVEFVIANNGGTDAKIIEANATVWLTSVAEHWPARPPYGDSSIDALRGVVVRDGHSIPCTIYEGEKLLNRVAILEADDLAYQTVGLALIGYIVYADVVAGRDQGRYRMAFCRVYDHLGRRFVPRGIDDRDYEYQP